jgi:hypothetical protein
VHEAMLTAWPIGRAAVKPGRLETPFENQFLPLRDRVGAIDPQHLNRRPADRSPADEHRTFPAEMFHPAVAARSEERDHPLRVGVDAREIRPLEAIAGGTCECEVGRLGTAAMFPRKDVIDLERDRERAFG